MVFRKPYALFIKLFKPIHLIIALIIMYLIYLDSKILSFLNNYIYTYESVVGETIKNNLGSFLLYLIPIVILLVSMGILGVMIRKRKPSLFYVINIFAYIVILVINIYSINFLGVLEESIVSIGSTKLIHDLVLITIVLENISLIFFIVRGIGLNIKKFDFDSEISKLDINESDKEEIELDINVDLSETKRRRKERLRNLKYKYFENKFIINIAIVVFILLVIGIVIFVIIKNNSFNKEGKIYSTGKFNIAVDQTIILNTDYTGKKITDNYLVVVNCKLSSNSSKNKIYLDDFVLNIGNATFKPTKKYSDYLIDIGNVFDESALSSEYVNYLFVYEISEKFIDGSMIFNYINSSEKLNIKLNPTNLVSKKLSITKNIGEEISFEDTIGDIKFKINDFDIKNKFALTYNYCIKNDDCILSKEYLTSSIDKNFDKVILKLSVDYTNNSNLNLKSFYNFFTRFGTIYYSIDGTLYSQKSNFEELKSSKVKDKNVYIGINSEILNAESVSIVFNIRNSNYEYILK